MADNLIFPIKFDLEGGVKEAIKDGDKALDRIATALEKNPITIKLRMDNKVPRGTSAELTGFKKQLAELTQQWNSLTAAERGGASGAAIREKFRALRQEAQGYTSTLQAAVKAEDRLRNAQNKTSVSTRNLGKEYQNTSSYLKNLLTKTAALWSLHEVSSFLTGVRDVTAEFELQRVSLGAIIQDQQRANQLFSEIKSFALQSPLKILDLTKYTKQVAAYGIETEKLFDTTKRLADVSVGLGVDMGRLVLAYGQVKAASYLRAAEIRQFTEAGIPMLELLAKKFTDLQGKMVSTEQVMDLVSKRAVSFSMVEEIFNDMTSAGGMFYNMQEKQAQTLFGMWSKLGDAAAMMYDEIGNTDWVNSGMKMTIGLLESMMRNWRLVGGEIIVVGAAMSIIAAKSKAQATTTALQASALSKVRSAGAAYNAILAEEARLLKTGTAAQLQSVAARKANAKAALDAAIAEKTAAAATNIWTRSIQKLKAALAGNWITLLITAVAALGVAIYDAVRNATKLDRELQKIGAEGVSNMQQAVSNFQLLADKAVNAADGSKKQREALDELHRTYKDMIPAQDMTIDKLRAMKGNYEQLTIAIREYIAQQTLATKISTIIENTSADIKDYRETLEDGFADVLKLSKDQIRNALVGIEALARTTTKDTITIIREAFKDYAGVELTDSQIRWMQLYRGGLTETKQAIYGFIDAIKDQKDRIAEASSDMTDDVAYFGIYADRYKEVQDKLQKTIDAGVKTDKGIVIAKNTYLYDRKVANMQIKSDIEYLKAEMIAAGVKWKDEWVKVVENIKSETDEISFMNWDAINEAFRDAIAGKDVSNTVVLLQRQAAKIQNAYNDFVPSKDVIKAVQSRFRELADGMGLQMDKIKQYAIGNNEDITAYVKKLEGDLENIKKQRDDIALIEKNRAAGIGKGVYKPTDEDLRDLEKSEKFIQALLEYLADYRKSSGRASDPRLQNLKEEISLYEKLYQEYKQYEKTVGSSKAAEYMEREAKETIDVLAKKYGIGLPKNVTDLTSALEILYEKMQALPSNVFKNLDKELKEFRWKIEKVDIDDSQKKIEAQLKELANRVARTKTAKEFYDKMLNMTGDVELSANIAMSVFGDTGKDLARHTIAELEKAFGDVDISEAINKAMGTIDYSILRKKLNLIDAQEQKKEAENLVDIGEKANAEWLLDTFKVYEKFKTFEEQRTEIVRRETEKRNQIINSNLPDAQKAMLFDASMKKQVEELNDIDWKEFKESDDWIRTFENIDNVATATIEHLIVKLRQFIDTNKDLTPEQLRIIMREYDKLYDQFIQRNPFKAIVEGIREYKAATRELAEARKEQQEAQKEMASAQAAYEEAYQAYLKGEGDIITTTNAYVNAAKRKKSAQETLAQADERLRQAEDKQKKSLSQTIAGFNAAASAVSNLQSILSQVVELFSVAEDSELGAFLQEVGKWLGIVAAGLSLVAAIIAVIEAELAPILAAAAGIAAIGALFTWLANSKVRRANKEIEKQQGIIDQLEYSYGRLEKAAEKAFGGDYIKNFKDRQANLQAQIEATQKQLAAEQSKGKKTDDDKVKEYQERIRDLRDQINDMQGELAEHFAGTDITSAARDFANAWIEAKTSFENTTDAMREKFADMVQNMIVEAMAAKIMEASLSDFYKSIDEAAKDGDITSAEIANSVQVGLSSIDAMNQAMEVLWAQLKAAGVDTAKIWNNTQGDLTGISRDIASASEESINGLAAGINTQNYYMSFVPQIAEHVTAIRQFMERGVAAVTPVSVSAGWTDWQQQAMDNYNAIARNTAETVAECRRSAAACEAFAADIHRIIKVKGATQGINVFLNS